jgi:hypothetical protein
VFTIPLWRHVMTWLGAAPATVKSFKRMLRRGSVGLVPGEWWGVWVCLGCEGVCRGGGVVMPGMEGTTGGEGRG